MEALRALARQAVADADARDPGGLRKPLAVKLLRDADGKARMLAEYVAAVNWALEHPGAADLPDSSVVAWFNRVYVKDHPTKTAQWRATNGGYYSDEQVDECLVDGAAVLRVGTRGEPGQ